MQQWTSRKMTERKGKPDGLWSWFYNILLNSVTWDKLLKSLSLIFLIWLMFCSFLKTHWIRLDNGKYLKNWVSLWVFSRWIKRTPQEGAPYRNEKYWPTVIRGKGKSSIYLIFDSYRGDSLTCLKVFLSCTFKGPQFCVLEIFWPSLLYVLTLFLYTYKISRK